MILSVDTVTMNDEGLVHVQGTIEDSKLVYKQTLYDPPEYGPQFCEASFILGDEDMIPNNEADLIKFLENLDLNWYPVGDYSC